ncbi:Serine/threonine-protein kinase Kist [Tupaia chinensis]|uniref:Serine/threonine-protein kinase Kist n=2 Tax=Euarchontoglires TaxID=314146 RepID=L9L7L3_TUPCH|nr:Serine/threonine-protein kinase Kist [Tupaia chinensis]
MGPRAVVSQEGSVLSDAWCLHDLDRTYTCMAQNPVSNHSSTPLPVGQLCTGLPKRSVSSQERGSWFPSWGPALQMKLVSWLVSSLSELECSGCPAANQMSLAFHPQATLLGPDAIAFAPTDLKILGSDPGLTLYGVFTIHFSPNVPSRCLLLELLDVSVSELLLYSSHQGCSMWMIQHCARDVLEALAFLHHEGYVHADLKPRNILWSAENECFKLIDFGLSFKEGNQDVKYIQTDGYRAPEAELQNCLAQAGLQSDTECTSAVDLWSLGIILLEMFSGMKLKHTVRSQEWKANSSAIIDHIFASKAVVNAAIPAYHLRDLIKSMLHDDPSRRIPAEMALCSPFFSIPFAPHIEDLVMLPTPVLRLLNVLDDDYLENEEEYEDVVEDVKEECQKYGPVVSLLVPKENPGRGQVFVEYANAGDSKAAQKLLTGRMFDGKFVVATFYPLSAYKRGYLYQTLL